MINVATKTAPKKKVPAKKAASKPVPEAVFSSKEEPAVATAKPKAGKRAAAKPKAGTKTKSTAKASTATKAAAKSGKTKVAAKSKEFKGRGGQSLPRDLNEHGFVIGSDSAKIVDILLEGGADRLDMNAKVQKAIGSKKTRNGNDPNVSSLIANVLRRLREKGYTVESSWVLKTPTPASKAAATRAANKAGKVPAAKKPAAAKGSATVKGKAKKKVPAKRSK